jgi:hypothetical protein
MGANTAMRRVLSSLVSGAGIVECCVSLRKIGYMGRCRAWSSCGRVANWKEIVGLGEKKGDEGTNIVKKKRTRM